MKNITPGKYKEPTGWPLLEALAYTWRYVWFHVKPKIIFLYQLGKALFFILIGGGLITLWVQFLSWLITKVLS